MELPCFGVALYLGQTRGGRCLTWNTSLLGFPLPVGAFRCLRAQPPTPLPPKGAQLPCAYASGMEWKVCLLLQTVVVIARLRGESICAANGHLHNPISLYCVISTVGLPRGVGREELGNINRKMTSSKRAPFSTYCRLASWFRADKQILA